MQKDIRINGVIRFAVERRVTMAMAVLGVMVLGWLSLERLPLEFLPAFSSSRITVNAAYPSSSPEETERLIVRHLEDSLGTINDGCHDGCQMGARFRWVPGSPLSSQNVYSGLHFEGKERVNGRFARYSDRIQKRRPVNTIRVNPAPIRDLHQPLYS